MTNERTKETNVMTDMQVKKMMELEVPEGFTEEMKKFQAFDQTRGTLIVNCWDEISCEWQQVEVDLPEDATPEQIAFTLDAQTSGIDPEDFHSVWEVKSYARTGPILTIETRSSRNHLSILVINFEENPVVQPLVNPFKSQGLAHDPEKDA